MDAEAHILVVDDDSQVRQLLGRLLRENGYRVTGARDALDMRSTLASADIDLIILDLMLPGASGLDLCRELRTTSSVPIIMLTAKGEDTDRISVSRSAQTITFRNHSIRGNCWPGSGLSCAAPPRRRPRTLPGRAA